MSANRRHPPESCRAGWRARGARPVRSRRLANRHPARVPVEARQSGREQQVLLDGQQSIDARFLEDEAKPPANRASLPRNVVAEHARRAARGREQRRQQ